MKTVNDVRIEILNIKIDLHDQWAESNFEDDSIEEKIKCLDMAYDILLEYENL